MLETSFESPLEKMRKEDWATLTAEEKAFCLNYERIILRDGKATWAMVNRMTALYEKYPDINVNACIPKSTKIVRSSDARSPFLWANSIKVTEK